MTEQILPFTFLSWKEDERALVAGTPDTSLGYILLLQIDGIDADEIVQHIKDIKGEEDWQRGLAAHFPEYVAAVAQAKGTPCFVTTHQCAVEYADINTSEVLEITLPATAENYLEAVRVEKAREEHASKVAAEKKAAAAAQKAKKSDKKPRHGANAAEQGSEAQSEDEYEDVSDDDEEGEKEGHGAAHHFSAGDDNDDDDDGEGDLTKQHFMHHVATQFEAAIWTATNLGITESEISEAFKSVLKDAHDLEEAEPA